MRFAGADVSERVVLARVPAICKSHAGVEVPMPRLNAYDDLTVVLVATSASTYNGAVEVDAICPL